jgi:hypothetical protein
VGAGIRIAAVTAACALALALASCDGADTTGSAEAKSGQGDARASAIAQFDSPRKFWCLPGHPGQAQVIVGWSVPSAKKVAVFLDGRRLHSGIREKLPYWVPAGDASGIGATVVFRCGSAERHRVRVRWRIPSSPAVNRTVTIHKAPER